MGMLPRFQISHYLNYKGNISGDQFKENIAKVKEEILAGEAFQVVLSQRFAMPMRGRCHRCLSNASSLHNPSSLYVFVPLSPMELKS